jgi:lipopolysaccharide transport system ATP-binding protein
VRTKDGQVSDAVDIRKPVGLEMEYQVLQPGHLLAPNFHVFNEEGVYLFVTNDQGPDWRHRPRPAGRYISTAWIPANYLAEGTLIVGAAISTLDPVAIHVYERDAVAFQVIDSLEGDSARGDYAGPFPGVIRPLLPWETSYCLGERELRTVAETEGLGA